MAKALETEAPVKQPKARRKGYHTPTAVMLRLHAHEMNPVTRAVYRQIIGNRIDSGRAQ